MCPYRPNHFKLCRYFEPHEFMKNRCGWLSEKDYELCRNDRRHMNVGNLETKTKSVSWDLILKRQI